MKGKGKNTFDNTQKKRLLFQETSFGMFNN